MGVLALAFLGIAQVESLDVRVGTLRSSVVHPLGGDVGEAGLAGAAEDDSDPGYGRPFRDW